MAGFIGGVIGFVVGVAAGITIMCVLVVGKRGDVENASPIDDSSKEIVRCKDCRHLMFSDCYGECSKGYMGIVLPNDFCSKGERKE